MEQCRVAEAALIPKNMMETSEDKKDAQEMMEMRTEDDKDLKLAAHIVKYCFVLSKTDMDFIL